MELPSGKNVSKTCRFFAIKKLMAVVIFFLSKTNEKSAWRLEMNIFDTYFLPRVTLEQFNEIPLSLSTIYICIWLLSGKFSSWCSSTRIDVKTFNEYLGAWSSIFSLKIQIEDKTEICIDAIDIQQRVHFHSFIHEKLHNEQFPFKHRL